MAKLESYGVGLLPIALAAGMLSGTLFRQPAATEASKPTAKPAEEVRPATETPPTAWLSDLRPVMEAMGDAMGLSLQGDAVTRIAGVTGAELDNTKPADVIEAIARVRGELQKRLSNSGACDADALQSDEHILNAYLLSDKDSGTSSRKLRSSVAEASLNEVQDWRSLATLARNVKEGGTHYEVQFIIATVPDYVDSNAGWYADQSLAAIQSAMSRSGYVLDRFRLIDWTRTDPRSDNPVSNESHLHERQPGALIFRSQKGSRVSLEVVLLALETPTSGVHRAALRNGIRFIRAWNQCSGGIPQKSDLRVLGPTFSGSSLSMALTLNDSRDRFADAFDAIRVVSGSATVDTNVEVFRTFAPRKTNFAATVPPTSETRRIMSAFLERMNPAWSHGRHVAFLLESNTAYGQAPTKYEKKPDDPFEHASVFYFPLHVSQLRNDAPAASTSSVTLLPTPAVPLNMRETTPPADQIPALRPQLTSSVVESTVDTILDTIRHERLSAVGIQATDDRDVLFLAREVKRAAPDVQLFFLGAHALYLHQDYIPYLRGTLVASPYSLSLTTQKGISEAGAPGREPFQSMAAEGLFNATLLLMEPNSDRLLDYCDPAVSSPEPCRSRVAISVIGEDGFWPLSGVERTNDTGYVQASSTHLTRTPSLLPPLPTQARIVIALLAVFVLAQVVMLLVISIQLRRGVPARRFLEWPVLRVFAPPMTYSSAATAYRLGMLLCFVVVTLISAWVAAVVMLFKLSESSTVLHAAAALLGGGLVLVPAVLLIEMSKSAVIRGHWPQAARRKSSWMLMPTIVLFGVSIGSFVAYIVGLLRQPGNPGGVDLTLARLVGGGIVSPASATLCLFAGLYAGTFAVVRRASLVGNGYTQLEEGSPAFALLNGRSIDADRASHSRLDRSRLGDVLDMPAQNLPLTYVLAILLVIVIAGFSVERVSTVDGQAFTWFLASASATVLMFGLVNLAQGLLIWNTARAHLKWLALSPIEGAFKSIASLVPWDLSLAPPRLMELMPVARRADGIIGEFRGTAGRTERSGHPRAADEPYFRRSTDVDRRLVETKLAIRRGDLDVFDKEVNVASKVTLLECEIDQHQQAAFMQSSTWLELWKVSDAIVSMLRTNAWRRFAPERHAAATPSSSGLPVLLSVSSMPEVGPVEVGISTQVKMAAVLEAPAGADAASAHTAQDSSAGMFRHCEEFVALQFAFVLRDIVARTVASLFAAMLCLTFLTAAHLLYSFNGRSALLAVDLLAVAAAAVTSIWILVGMEREAVLSRLRNTTPGRLDINWAFVQRVAVYGVLPLLAVLASLFPEIGNSLFGWLEPLRKLSNF